MPKPITAAQRKVLEAGRAYGYAFACGLMPPMSWALKDQTRVTASVETLRKAGLMQIEGRGGNRVARITDLGRAALSES